MKSLALVTLAVAAAVVAPAFATTIHDVQYTTDPSGNSPLMGQVVGVEGIVYALYPPRSFAIAEAPGAWHGVYVYLNPSPATLPVALGDTVQVTGTVQEYYNLTEIVCAASAVTVVGSGGTSHAPSVVTTAEVATGSPTAESYEGVLVEVQDVEVTSPPNFYGEWLVDDGSGAVMVDDLADYTYAATLGDQLDYVRGMLFYNFDDFKIEPRGDSDIQQQTVTPTPHTIAEIQGSGFASPLVNEAVETSGIVVGFFEGNVPGGGTFDAFFLQDPTGDGNDETSEGLMVVASGLPGGLALGDAVTVIGTVKEYGEYDGTACLSGCMTTVFATSFTETGTGSVTPALLDPPTDPDGQVEYLEQREGMRLSVDGSGTVVGPTSFGTIYVVDSDEGVTRALRNSAQHGKVVGVRHWELFGDIGGADPPNLIVGSTVANLDGPLTTTYGDYVVVTQAGDAWSVVSSVPTPPTPPTVEPPADDRFAVATLNCENFDAGDAVKLAKVVDSIVALGCPTLLSLQEVDTQSTLAGGEDDVLPTLLTALSAEGCPYDAASSHPDVGDHGVAALWRTDRVTGVTWTDEYQACSPVGSSSSSQYDPYCDGVPGEYPLFSRRPTVVTATLAEACPGSAPIQVTLIAVHFKSKVGGDPASDQRRLEQGQFVAALVDTLVAGGSTRVLVAGDLNDFEDAPPVAAMTGDGGLRNVWGAVSPDNRFSYIYGGISQILDHILASPGFVSTLVAVEALRHNADFPFRPFADDGTVVWKTSDHDPVVATFEACVPLFADDFESGTTDAWSTVQP